MDKGMLKKETRAFAPFNQQPGPKPFLAKSKINCITKNEIRAFAPCGQQPGPKPLLAKNKIKCPLKKEVPDVGPTVVRSAFTDVGNKQDAQKPIISKGKINSKIQVKKDTKTEILPPKTVPSSPKQALKTIDCEDDPQLVNEYAVEIFSYLMTVEKRFTVSKDFIEKSSVNPYMRNILVDWMADVCSNYKFTKETFHLSVNLMDRYLPLNLKIKKANYQLVGVAAMLIASKYEEILLPELKEWIYLSDDLFTKEELLLLELDMLKKLEFNLTRPTAIVFLRRYNKIMQASSTMHETGKYILDLALMEHQFSSIRPSMQAAAACLLSQYIFNKRLVTVDEGWTSLMVQQSHYKYLQIKPIVNAFASLLLKAVSAKRQTIRTLYSSSKHLEISNNSNLTGLKVNLLARLAPNFDNL